MAVPTHPPRLSVAAIALAAVLGVSSAAVGRDVSSAGSGQAADGLCALLTAKEVAAAVGEKMAVVTNDSTFCSYGATKSGAGTPTTVTIARNPGVPDEGPLIEQARASIDGAVDVEVAGVPALFVPAEDLGGVLEASLDLFPDVTTWLELVADVPTKVDARAALTDLAAIALSRLGAGASPAPDASPANASLCAMLTTAEVSAELGGLPLSVVDDRPDTCAYSGEASGDADTVLTAKVVLGAPEVGSNIDTARATYPDAVEIVVAGVPALQTATETPKTGWTRSALHVFPDAATRLTLEASAPESVDVTMALNHLAELAVPRLAAIMAPPSGSPSPAPSSDGRTGLDALFPTDIGGSPVAVQPATLGGFLSADPAKAAAIKSLTKSLKAQGMKVQDVPVDVGQTDAQTAAIIAIQVTGADITPFVAPLTVLLDLKKSATQPTQDVVVGKSVTAFEGSGGTAYVYPKDDVLWVAFAQGPDVTEIFEKLP